MKADKILVGRIGFVVAGVLLLAFGVFRLLTELAWPTLISLAIWMGAAILVHDLLIAPTTLGVAALLGRIVPDRARRWLQFWLIASALVTVIAIPLMVLQGSQPAQKALLIGPYAPGWALLLGIFALIAGLGYLRDRRREDRAGPVDADGSPF